MLVAHWPDSRRDSSIGPLSLQGMFYYSARSYLIPAVGQITIGQASIEALFIESLTSKGISVDRPIVPSSLEISQDPEELLDPSSYPVKVLEILIPTRHYF
jgi:hypothetical protein